MGLISIPVHGQPHGQNGVGEKLEGGKNGRKKGGKGTKEKEKIQTPYPAVFATITEIAEFPLAVGQIGQPVTSRDGPQKIPLAMRVSRKPPKDALGFGSLREAP